MQRHRMRFAGVIAALAAVVGPLSPVQASAPAVEVVVQATDVAAARAAVEAAGGSVTSDLSIINGVGAEVPASAVASLGAADGVVAVTPNAPVTLQANPSPLHAATGVYPYAVGADDLWRRGLQGQGTTVAVMDTGIAPVADLAGRLVGGVDLSGEGDPYDDRFGHGTFVAGLIAGSGVSSGGTYKGVAPAANLVSIKIGGADGSSDVTHVLAGLQWAVSFKDTYSIDVLNLSLGTDSTQPYMLSPLDFAVERAWEAGIVVVVSASNSGPGAGTITKPGDDPLVITVGASDDLGTKRLNDDVMAGFSGQGPTAADGLAKPDLVAPGRSVVSLRSPGSTIDAAYPTSRVGTSYFKGSGTSFSTGITSGAAALLLQGDPSLTPGQVKTRLLTTTSPGPVGDRMVDGHGQLNVAAAADSTATADANAGIPRSMGGGTLQADRGSLQVSVDTGSLLVPLLSLVTGELTTQNNVFDAVEYFATDPARSRWYGSRWYESQWYGSRWYGSRWYGSRWYGSRWYTSEWYGSRWYGTAWE